jgi:hypothetical protein
MFEDDPERNDRGEVLRDSRQADVCPVGSKQKPQSAEGGNKESGYAQCDRMLLGEGGNHTSAEDQTLVIITEAWPSGRWNFRKRLRAPARIAAEPYLACNLCFDWNVIVALEVGRTTVLFTNR